jgi:hypothetical protein
VENKLERRYSLVGQLLADVYVLFALTDGAVFYDIATGRAYARRGHSNTTLRAQMRVRIGEGLV